MKYLFIITGIAYGHFTREESIINKLRKLDRKAEIVIACYGTSHNYFRKKYKILELKPLHFPDTSTRARLFRTLAENYKILGYTIDNYNLINEFNREFKPDFIMSDWEPFAIFIKNCYLTWNYKPKYSKPYNLSLLFQKILIESLYFTARLLGKKIILPSLKKEKNVKNFIYAGLIIRKTPDEVKELKEYKDTVLVMLGGSKFGLGLAEKIKNISKDFNEKFVIFGCKCKTKNCIGYSEFRENYLEYLKSCKVVITLGGYSGISEAVFFRKPVLAFPIKNLLEQYAVVEEFKDYIDIGDINLSEEELKIKIKEFLNNADKSRKKLNTLKLRNGADEIAELIYKKAKS